MLLIPLVLWFESVARVDIQPLLGREHVLDFQVATDYASKKGLRQAITQLLFSGKTEGFQSTNPMDLQESKCSCSQSQF